MRIHLLLATLCFWFSCTSGWAFQNYECTGKNEQRFRIGVFYYNTGARKKLLDGAVAAVINYNAQNVCLLDLGYTDHDAGLDTLQRSIRTGSVDVLLGPTESDLFIRAIEEEHLLSEKAISIISPLVTADIDKETEWLFRTNVSVSERAQVMFDFLRKYWIRSIAVLYANTAFGRQAEENFRGEYERVFKRTDLYTAVLYQPPPRKRFELGKILKKRPEAIGVFGEREDIKAIYKDLVGISLAGTTYQPYLFTLLDARQIRSDIDDLQREQNAPFYFVSVTGRDSTAGGPVQSEYDDVEALSYDTIAFILRALEEAGAPSAFATRKAYRTAFRNEFKVLMNHSDKLEGSLTNMAFAGLSNTASPSIYAIEADTLRLESAYGDVNSFTKLRNKASLVFARFGMFPWFCVFLIFVIVVSTSMLDLIRWYEGNWLTLLKHLRTYYLLGFQLAVSLALYLVLAETGKVAYDSITTTILIALAPTSFFRSKIIEMPGGQTLGFIKFYDRILQWLNEGLMVAKFENLESKVEFVAHYNSQKGMEEELRAIYGNARNPQQRLRLMNDLENQLKAIRHTFDQRKYCARLLLRRLDWEELKKRRLIPDYLNEDDDIKSPIAWIRESEKHCLENDTAMAALKKVLEDEGADMSERNKLFLDNKIKDDESLRGKLFTKIRFLVLKLGYTEVKLKAKGLLPDDYQPQSTGVDDPGVRKIQVVEEEPTRPRSQRKDVEKT